MRIATAVHRLHSYFAQGSASHSHTGLMLRLLRLCVSCKPPPWHNLSPKLHHCNRYLFCLHLSFLPRQTRVARSKSNYRLPHTRFLSAPNHGYKAWPPMAHHTALAIGATPKMAAPSAAGASCNGQVVVPVQVQDRDVEVDGVDLVVLKRRCLIRDAVLIKRLLESVRKWQWYGRNRGSVFQRQGAVWATP